MRVRRVLLMLLAALLAVGVLSARTAGAKGGHPKGPPPRSGDSRVEIVLWLSSRGRTGKVDIKKLWDGYNNCVKDDATNPGQVDAPSIFATPSLNIVHLSVTARGGVFEDCGYETSKMHWRLSGRLGETAEVQLSSYGGSVTASCGPKDPRWDCSKAGTGNVLYISTQG